jgi:hypothetical protein
MKYEKNCTIHENCVYEYRTQIKHGISTMILYMQISRKTSLE